MDKGEYGFLQREKQKRRYREAASEECKGCGIILESGKEHNTALRSEGMRFLFRNTAGTPNSIFPAAF